MRCAGGFSVPTLGQVLEGALERLDDAFRDLCAQPASGSAVHSARTVRA